MRTVVIMRSPTMIIAEPKDGNHYHHIKVNVRYVVG